MRVVSRWCRCIVQRLCATDCKRPCLVRAAAPHSAPARTPGVYAQRLYAMTHTSGRTKSVQDAPTTNDHDCTDAEPTKHTHPFPGERGLGLGILNKHSFEKQIFLQVKMPFSRHCNNSILKGQQKWLKLIYPSKKYAHSPRSAQ